MSTAQAVDLAGRTEVASRTEAGTVAPHPASDTTSLLQVITRAASDASVDIDKMERLMQMHERLVARDAKQAFFTAFAAAQAEMPQIVRDAENDQTKSKYAKYETISDAIQPILAKHGFSLTFGEGDPPREGVIRIICKAMHIGGHSEDYHSDIPIDMYGMKGNPNKTPTHAYGSTKSYGRRYLKLDIFDIALTGGDDDGNSADRKRDLPTISEAQVKELFDLIEQAGTTSDKFCSVGKIGAVPDLLAKDFDNAKNWLSERIAARKAKPAVDPKDQFDRMEGGQ